MLKAKDNFQTTVTFIECAKNFCTNIIIQKSSRVWPTLDSIIILNMSLKPSLLYFKSKQVLASQTLENVHTVKMYRNLKLT